MKDLGVKPYVFPMPVALIATYNDDGTVDVMNMAWGGICEADKVALNLDGGHRTTENIRRRRAFTLSLPDVSHIAEADYSISSKEFYDIYKQWCEDNACHSVSAIRFSAELRQNDRRYNLEATNNIYLPGGRRVRGFVGIEPLVHPCP